MASVYKKGKKIYISWYDCSLQKRLNKSLGMEYNQQNMKKAKQMAKKFGDELQKEKDKNKNLGITRKTIGTAFEHFLNNNLHKHPKTIVDYHRFFNRFKQTFNEDGTCATIKKLACESWLNELKKLDYKKNTIFGYYKQFNHFLNFLFEYNYIPMFKINRDVKPKVENVEKIIISLEDLALIFTMLNDEKKTDNFKHLIYILYYTGLRASDVLSIKIEDVDITNHTFKYFSPKRKVYREIAFHKDLVVCFEEIKSRKLQGSIVDYGTVDTLQRAISRYMESIELTTKKYSSRSFRKTFVTIARRNKMDESIVKELVGHAHTSTTDKFYNKIDLDQMKEELLKYIPVNKLPYDLVRERVDNLKSKKVKGNEN
ncbi:MAG: tyrosine-type recombinase/integrase [Melioribacteraceae bacterium]